MRAKSGLLILVAVSSSKAEEGTPAVVAWRQLRTLRSASTFPLQGRDTQIVSHRPLWLLSGEMQATDRTHRIGQDKPVFIYKLIVRESVEEKILQLQERKRALVTQLIATESSFSSRSQPTM